MSFRNSWMAYQVNYNWRNRWKIYELFCYCLSTLSFHGVFSEIVLTWQGRSWTACLFRVNHWRNSFHCFECRMFTCFVNLKAVENRAGTHPKGIFGPNASNWESKNQLSETLILSPYHGLSRLLRKTAGTLVYFY